MTVLLVSKRILYRFLYQDPAFEAFDDFSDFVESISCETSESCQVRGSNPCRTDRDCLCVDQEPYDVFVSLFFVEWLWRSSIGMLSKVAIATRRNAQEPHECSSHRIDAAETRSERHMLKPVISAF